MNKKDYKIEHMLNVYFTVTINMRVEKIKSFQIIRKYKTGDNRNYITLKSNFIEPNVFYIQRPQLSCDTIGVYA